MKDYLYLLLIIILLYSCKKKKTEEITVPEAKIENGIIEKIISKTNKGQILICAHRSYHKNAPENSLQSIKEAIKAGIDFVELDVRTTKDSILVLMHDDSIGRMTTGIGRVNNYTYKQLQILSLKMDDSITSHKVPLLRDALLLAKGKVIPNLDLKDLNYNQLYKILQELEMDQEVISFIGNKEKVMQMIGIDSLYAVLPLSKTKEEMIFYNENTKSSLQHFTEESFTVENMKWAHDKGELVFINTLWEEDDNFIQGNTQSMDSVIALKPAIIQTDHPKLLLTYLQSKNLHN